MIVFAVIAIAVTSCKKDNVNKPINQDDELIAKSKKVISLIEKFDEKMSSNLKSGEVIGVDSAVWNLEALQNYKYANPSEATRDFEVAKSNYSLLLNGNGQVLMSDVQAVYAQMEDALTLKLQQIPSDEKVVRFADVSLDSIEGNTAHLSTTLGFGYNWLLGRYWPFSTSDNWYWGTLSQEYGRPPMGKCDGTQVGVSDASDELQWRLNNPVVLPTGPFIWIDLETNENVIGYNHLDTIYEEPRLYVGWDYPDDNCLTHDTLTHYLVQSHHIINDYSEGVRPAGLSFASVYIDDDLLLRPNYQGQHYHRYEVTYGTMVKVGLPK